MDAYRHDKREGDSVKKLLALVILAVLSAACRVEWRGSELWACDTIQTAAGPMEACQPTGWKR
jgi:hypothetical protein